MKKRTWFFYGILSLGFLASPLIQSQSKIPSLVGQFGFDWLNPDQAECEKISPTLQSQFKSCEVHGPDATGSFTGKKDFHSCKDGKSHEFMIFKSQARCTEELETMRANGD